MANISSLFPSQGDAALKSGNLSDLADLTEARANLNTWTTKTAAYTAVDGDWIRAHTSGGAFTITLPASPADGTEIRIADTGHWAINNLTIARNGKTIVGLSEDIVCDVSNVDHSFRYVSADGNWEVQSNAVTTGDAGQAWTLLETQTASNDSSIDFTTGLSSDYIMYVIIVDQFLPATDTARFGMRFSSDDGASWDSGASDYESLRFLGSESGTGHGFNTNTYALLSTSIGNVAAEEQGLSGEIKIYGAHTSDKRTRGVLDQVSRASDTSMYVEKVYFERTANQEDNAFQIISSSGNITSGTFKLYGVR